MSTYLGTYTGRRGEPQVFFSDLDRVTYAIGHRLATDGHDTRSEEIRRPAPINESDVISSELPDGRHAPCIDVFVRAVWTAPFMPGERSRLDDLDLPAADTARGLRPTDNPRSTR